MAVERNRGQSRRRFLIRIGAITLGASAVSFYGYKMRPVKKELDFEEKTNIPLNLTEEEKDDQIRNHFATRSNLEAAFKNPPLIEEKKIDEKYIGQKEQEARTHLDSAIHLVNTHVSQEHNGEVQVDQATGKIKIDGFKFVLSKPLHFHVAAALLDVKLSEAKGPEIQGSYLRDRDEDDLLYLAYSGVPLTIESGSYGLVPVDKLLTISRLHRLLTDFNLPFPDQIIFREFNHDAKNVTPDHDNFLSRHQYPDDISSEYRLRFENKGEREDIVKEFGYYFVERAQREKGGRLSRFSFENFNLNRAPALNALKGKGPYIEDDIRIIYAQTFANYFANGDGARLSIIGTQDRDK